MKLRTWCIRSGQILAKPVLVFAGFLVFLTIFNPATIQAEDGRGTITIRHENVPIQKVFQSIEKQSGYRFFYNETLLQGAVKVTLHLQNVSLQEALDACFRNQPLSYAIVDKTIIVKRRPEQQSVAPIPAAVSFSAPKKGKLIAVRGKVTSNNIPVVGASIMIKGTDNGASTDKDGIFTLAEVDEEATLVVSSVSHQAREVRLNGQTFISIDLSQKSDDLDEAMVVAYNTTTKRMNTGAVTVVKGEDIQNMPARSVDRALQGMVPGLQITSGSGMPGAQVANITLRGIATGGTGTARNPLYVVDGTVVTQDNFNGDNSSNAVATTNPMAQINPNDIESISVLKDAAAIALYGSRASNGVILITTKHGKTGKLRIDFRHQTDLAKRFNPGRDVLNQNQYLGLLYEAYKNANPGTWTDQAIYNDLKNKFPYRVVDGDTGFYSAPDWNKELYKNGAAAVSNDLSLSGGSDKVTYYLGLGYLKQDGILKNTSFNRSSIRYNVDIRPTSWFKLGVNSSFSNTVQNHNGNILVADGITSVTGFTDYVSPLLPIRQDNGNYMLYYPFGAGGNTVANPIASMEYNINRADAYRGLGNMYAEVNFFRDFSFRTNLGIDVMSSKTAEKDDKRVDGTPAPGTGTYIERYELRSILLVNNMLRYQKSIHNAHAINVLLSQEAQTIKTNFLTGFASGFSSGYPDNEINSGTTKTSGGNTEKTTLLSYLAQVNYDFKKKLFVTVSGRLDGSSRFGIDVPLNKFWSLGGGWVLSEESFLKHSLWLNFLKFRGSLGVAGNTNSIPADVRYNTVAPLTTVNTPATIGTSIDLRYGNPEITSESTFNTDIGVEARFWNQRINLTADVYRRKTYDMFGDVPIALVNGGYDIRTNLGDMENKGVELSLSVDVVKAKNFNWNISGNWSTNKNKLVKADEPETYTGQFINKVGENFNSWYMLRWAGVDPADGTPQWFDREGKITKIASATSKVFIGAKPQPDGFGSMNTSFRYKNLELSVFFYYAYGYKIYNSWLQNMINDGRLQPYSNQSVLALDRWQKPGDIALNPKRVLNNTATGNINSTRFLVDGDYIRLKNIMLTYSLNNRLISKLHLSNTRFFIQLNNVSLWTKANAIDPDNTGVGGENLAAYPQQKTMSLGLNVSF